MINGYSKGLYDGIGDDRPPDWFKEWWEWACDTGGIIANDLSGEADCRAAFEAAMQFMMFDEGYNVPCPEWLKDAEGWITYGSHSPSAK